MIDQFFRDYLTYKNGAIPNFGRICEEFKNYHIKAYLIKLDSYKVFPNDEQFGQDFVTRDIHLLDKRIQQ